MDRRVYSVNNMKYIILVYLPSLILATRFLKLCVGRIVGRQRILLFALTDQLTTVQTVLRSVVGCSCLFSWPEEKRYVKATTSDSYK